MNECILTQLFAQMFFAGKKVTTSAKDNTYNPRWLEELHLPLMLPSMCEKIKFVVSAFFENAVSE